MLPSTPVVWLRILIYLAGRRWNGRPTAGHFGPGLRVVLLLDRLGGAGPALQGEADLHAVHLRGLLQLFLGAFRGAEAVAADGHGAVGAAADRGRAQYLRVVRGVESLACAAVVGVELLLALGRVFGWCSLGRKARR